MGVARAKLNETRAFLNNHMLETTAPGKQELEGKIEANAAETNKRLAAVKGTLQTDAGKRSFAQLTQAREGL